MDRAELAAIPVLLREVGLVTSLKIGWAIESARRAGEPFAALGPPTSERERMSRAQIGPAIVLYQHLRVELGQTEALRVSELVVVESTIVFLRQSLGRLERASIADLDEAGRQQFVSDRGEKFFNATVEWDHIGTDRVDFTVRHCEFPPLCAAVGVPELAPVFCAGDAKFFGAVEKNVELVRPTTIASGDSVCAFSLRWLDED